MYICTVKNSIQNTPIVELHGNCLFVSDAHFRTPPDEASMDRELKLVQLFKNQEDKLQHIFFLGDIFDYWFEYRDVVPKGYVTLFACMKELHAQGTQIHYFTGNHDMWVEDYFTQTFGATVYHEARLVDINGHRCFVGHGAGIGNGTVLIVVTVTGWAANSASTCSSSGFSTASSTSGCIACCTRDNRLPFHVSFPKRAATPMMKAC